MQPCVVLQADDFVSTCILVMYPVLAQPTVFLPSTVLASMRGLAVLLMPLQHIAVWQTAAKDVQCTADSDIHTPSASLLHQLQVVLQAPSSPKCSAQSGQLTHMRAI